MYRFSTLDLESVVPHVPDGLARHRDRVELRERLQELRTGDRRAVEARPRQQAGERIRNRLVEVVGILASLRQLRCGVHVDVASAAELVIARVQVIRPAAYIGGVQLDLHGS